MERPQEDGGADGANVPQPGGKEVLRPRDDDGKVPWSCADDDGEVMRPRTDGGEALHPHMDNCEGPLPRAIGKVLRPCASCGRCQSSATSRG